MATLNRATLIPLGLVFGALTLTWAGSSFLTSALLEARLRPELLGLAHKVENLERSVDQLADEVLPAQDFEVWLERSRRLLKDGLLADMPK